MTRKKPDDVDAQLRAEPEYQDLCRLLDQQTPAQKHRLEAMLNKPNGVRRLREMIREEIEASCTGLKNEGNLSGAPDRFSSLTALERQANEQPPAIPHASGSNKFQGKRATLPGLRVDQVLFDLFKGEQQEARETASATMQRILWLHYGKPKLSFEE